jgi:hypothetical protein
MRGTGDSEMVTPSLSRDQTLWLLTAHSDTWKLGEAPAWLVAECANAGLAAPTSEPGFWKKTALANELLQRRLG